MEVKHNSQATRPEPLTELDIAMLNAHMTSSLSEEKPIVTAGIHPQATQIPVPVKSDLAALKWISGRPTLSQVLTPLIHAASTAKRHALVQSAETTPAKRDIKESATKTAVT